MPSRRRRLATLRVLGSVPHATDGHDDTGMDAPPEPHDAGRDTARPRSAPAFCRPKPVTPRPYQAPPPVRGTVRKPLAEPDECDEAPPAAVPPAPRPDIPRRAQPSPHRPGPRIASPVAPPEPPMAAPVSPYDAPRTARRVPEPSIPPRKPQPREPQEVRPIWDEPAEDAPATETLPERQTGPAWVALARGVALLLGTLLAVDLFADGGLPPAGPWWLDTRPLPEAVAAGLLGLSAAVLIAFAARPALPGPIRTVAMICVGLMIAVALKNATVYYGLLKRGDLHAGPPVAFPLHVAACLGVVLLALRSSAGPSGVRGTLLVLAGFNAALVALPVAQIACTGPVDARRPAAAAVVFAPRPFEKHPEDRLDDRVRTAAALHKSGTVAKLLFTGGPAGERLERMTRLTAEAGVPATAIETLPDGSDAATFRLLAEKYPEADGMRPTLLAVSDFDHLPRVQLAARRVGLSLSPVPAASTAEPSRTVLLREMIELWGQYFRR